MTQTIWTEKDSGEQPVGVAHTSLAQMCAINPFHPLSLLQDISRQIACRCIASAHVAEYPQGYAPASHRTLPYLVVADEAMGGPSIRKPACPFCIRREAQVTCGDGQPLVSN